MTFTAKYDGRCNECGETIYTGDHLDWDGGQVIHTSCLPDDAKEHPKRPTCPACWQELPLTGKCGNCA